MITLDLSILNQKGTPMFYSDIFANRPAFGIVGRIFISTDTYEFYRDTGSAWDLIGGTGTGTITGSGTIGTLSKFTSSSSIGDSIVSEIGSALNINGTAKATNWYVGTPTDLTRAFSASGNANNVALYLEEYGNTTSSADVFMYKGRGTESAKANIQIGDSAGAISTGGYLNGVLFATSNWYAEVVNIDTVNNHADTDWKLTQSYNSAGTTETFRIRASDGFVTAPNGGFSNTLTKTAISTEGWYGVASVENITLPANISFSNSGFTQGSLLGVNLMTFQGNATFANGNGTTSIFGQNGFGFSSAGSTITINQRSGGTNAFAGVTAYNYINGTTNGTITHLAGLHVLAPYQSSSAILSVTNYYGALINASNERTAFNITNRWGIYQEGGSDKNYFAGNLLLKSNVDNGNALQVTGNSNFTGTVGIGATNLFAKLQVNASGAGYQDVLIIENTNTPAADLGTAFTFAGIGSTAQCVIRSAWTSASVNDSYLSFLTKGSGSVVERMRITSGGDIGIGTASPSSYSGFTTLSINNSTNGAVLDLLVNNVRTGSVYSGISGNDFNINAVRNIPLIFHTNNTERMRITSGGDVGIGINSPTAKLDVFGDILVPYSTTDSFIGNRFSAAYYNGFVLNGNNRSTGIVSNSGDASDYIWFGTNTAIERMRITNGGNVLIGSSTNPGQKLYLNGSLRIDGQSSGTAGGSSGQHLIINLDGTTYKIALLNP